MAKYLQFDHFKAAFQDSYPELVIDANETAFLQRELTHLERTVYEVKRPELKHRQLIPVSNEGGPGLEHINYELVTKSGQAKIIGNHSQDIPVSSYFVQEFTKRVYVIADSFRITNKEMRSARRSKVPLRTTKASAMRRSIRETEKRIALQGDSTYNIVGLIDNPNITQVASPNGASLSPLWSTKTALEIVADCSTMTNTIATQSQDIHFPTTLVLPIAQKLRMGQLVMPNTTTTVKDFILANRDSFGYEEIISLPNELTAAFSGSDGALAYEKNSENLTLHIPMELRLNPPQRVNLETKIIGEEEIAGTVIRYPLAFVIMTGI